MIVNALFIWPWRCLELFLGGFLQVHLQGLWPTYKQRVSRLWDWLAGDANLLGKVLPNLPSIPQVPEIFSLIHREG